MSMLRQQLNDLASSFASSVLEAIRSASLEELLAESSSVTRRGTARLGRGGQGAGMDRAVVRGGGASVPRSRAVGRLARRSSDDIEQVIGRIAGLLKQHPKGLRAEEIRSNLGLLSKEMPRPLKEALDSGRLGKSGQKRATTYYVKSGGAAPAKGPGKGTSNGKTSKAAAGSGSGGEAVASNASKKRGAGRGGRGRRAKTARAKNKNVSA